MRNGAFWRFVQMADSGFPTGGFVHSGGLEAAIASGLASTCDDVASFASDLIWNTASGPLPFVARAHGSPNEVWALDERLDAVLVSHVANRASRTQGRAFAGACAAIFQGEALTTLARRARAMDAPAHFAPLFGAAARIVGLDVNDARALFLYSALRGFISAAVRLGILGPHEGQRLMLSHAGHLEGVLAATALRGPEDAATVAPILDLVGSTHDQLYARLFQS